MDDDARTALQELTEDCLVLLGADLDNEQGLGSGVWVAPGLVLTCAHVVPGGQGTRFQVRWRDRNWSATVVAWSPGPLPPGSGSGQLWPFPDVAVVQVDGVDDHRCALIAEQPVVIDGREVMLFGHSRQLDDHGQLKPLAVRTTLSGWNTHGKGRLLQIKHNQVLPGMSGGPALDLSTGRMCALTTTTIDAEADRGGYLLPMDGLTCLPDTDLRARILAAAAGYHARNPRWTQLCAQLRLSSDSRTGRNPRVIPRQLPRAAVHFAGRSRELETLNSLVQTPVDPAGPLVISAIGGMAGVGKTALAVYWAHRIADQFPDGQLYVNLQGFGPRESAKDSASVIRGFLDALDVPQERVPTDIDAQATLYRSLLAGRRMLILLDNARNAEQVRPLLPGAASCLVLITSRDRLSGLVATDGAYPVALDVLDLEECRLVLARRLGSRRVSAEPEAVDLIADRCGRLPLTLAIVAARAATHPTFSLASLAVELQDQQDRLGKLGGNDPSTDVRSVLSWSYQTLTLDAARTFRLLGMPAGPDITAAAAASLSALPKLLVQQLLSELEAGNLIVEHLPGRYVLHDLLRIYAAELAHKIDGDAQCGEAVHRLLDHYLHTACSAIVLLYPFGRRVFNLRPPRPGVLSEVHTGEERAQRWLRAECKVLLAAIDYAASEGWDAYACQLAWTIVDFLNRSGRWRDQAATQHVALAAARRLVDPSAQACSHRLLAQAYVPLGQYKLAQEHFSEAQRLYSDLQDSIGEALTYHNLASLYEQMGKNVEALSHAEQAMRLYRTAEHRRGHAITLNLIGWLHMLQGDYMTGLSACEHALVLLKELADREGEAAALDSIGYAHHHLGNHHEAIGCYSQALTIYRKVDDRHYEAGTLTHLADTYLDAGRRDDAHEAYQQALTIFTDLHHPDGDEVRAKLATLAAMR